jgi:hypothetical protein
LSSETAEQYIQRITADVEGKRPLAVQAATARKLARLIEGVPTGKLRNRPAPEKWSVNEILAHLTDLEITVCFRIRLVLGEPGSFFPRSIRMPRSQAVIMRSAIRTNQSSSFAWFVEPISLCSNR